MMMMPLLLLLGTALLATGAAAESSCSSSELEDDGCCPGYTPSNDVPPCPAGYSASTSTSINNWVEVYSCTCTPSSMSVSFDWSEASASTTMPIGLVSVALGLMIALFGYKLWKYTMFILGFLFGAAVGVGAAAASGTTTIAGLIVPGFVGGVFGGLLFLGCYMMVIFCTGCAFGMTAFYATVIALVVSSSSPTSVLEHTNADTLQTLYVLDLMFGVFCGLVFIKLQKICIMLGTSYVGASMFWAGCFQGFAQQAPSSTQVALVLISWVGAFCVQWFKTSKGVEIDEKTGAVTYVVVNQQPVLPVQAASIYAPPKGQQPYAAVGHQTAY